MPCVRIERAANGYTVSADDPKIVAANKKRDNSKGPYEPWRDPSKEYVFKTLQEVTTFLTKNLDRLSPQMNTAPASTWRQLLQNPSEVTSWPLSSS